MLTVQAPKRKFDEQDFARADLNFLMHVSQSETDHFYYLFLIFHLQFVDSQIYTVKKWMEFYDYFS